MSTTESNQHSDFTFDLDGGVACLDFVNTRSDSSGEHLNTYFDLVAFAQQSTLLTQVDADGLRARARRSPGAADAVAQNARVLREALRQIFSAVAAGGRPAEGGGHRLMPEQDRGLGRARPQD